MCYNGYINERKEYKMDVEYCKENGCEMLLTPADTDAGVYECGEDQNISLEKLEKCPLYESMMIVKELKV